MPASRVPRGRPDAGFTLVELLASLAISSAVLVGLTGLTVFIGRVSDRADLTEKLEQSLVAVRAASWEISRRAVFDDGTTLDLDIDGYRFETGDGQVIFGLSLADVDGLELQFSGGGQPFGRLQLADFDSAYLEYLLVASPDWSWRRFPVPPRSSVKAIRLVLLHGRWIWPTIMWSVPSGALEVSS